MTLAFEIRDVVVVAPPSGTSTTTRLRLEPHEEEVLALVVDHLSRLRRRDLALRISQGKEVSKETKAARKRAMTAESSSRWSGSIMRANDQQWGLARRAQIAHRRSLRNAIKAIETRLALPVRATKDSHPPKTVQAKTSRSKTGRPTKVGKRGKKKVGYRNQVEHAMKTRRLDVLKSRLAEVEADYQAGRVHVVDGGRKLLHKRHHLEEAGLTIEQWETEWDQARNRISAGGSRDESWGNLTIQVDPAGRLSIRLPRPLEHLANSPRGRYSFAHPVRFRHQSSEWGHQILTGAVGYTIARKVPGSRKKGKQGWYLTAGWSINTEPLPESGGKVLGLDLNGDHVAGFVLDSHGNPVGAPISVKLDIAGRRGDAVVRHACTQLVKAALTRGIDIIAVEDLGFDDARETGRETMGSGRAGKRFRRTVAGMPTAMFRRRLSAMTHRAGIRLVAVPPAYTSKWGKQHWLSALAANHKTATGHHAASVVIGRRAMGLGARRREGKPNHDQRIVRGEPPTRPSTPAQSSGSRPPGHRPPDKIRGRAPGRKPSTSRATVTPATAGRNPLGHFGQLIL